MRSARKFCCKVKLEVPACRSSNASKSLSIAITKSSVQLMGKVGLAVGEFEGAVLGELVGRLMGAWEGLDDG